MDRRIRSKKRNPRSARPYDRPNQSILGRVASKVKGLLNPSWIFNVSQWMTTPEEEPGSNDPQDEESAEEDDVPQSSTHGSKRLRLHDHTPSILSEGTQTWLDTPSSGLFNPASHLPSTVTQSSALENQESAVIMNGDDHSENSEGSASTSGCSSLVSSHKDRSGCIPAPNLRLAQSPFASLREMSRRDITSQKERLSANMSGSRMSLWSGSGGFSPAAKLQRRSPAVAQSNQPGFNVSAFVGPSAAIQQPDRKVASPFYQGRTSFGGAASTRRMPVSAAPYQVERPPRNQIKVRTNQSEDSLEGMSSAAKRILMTLEKMSSPVTDAKKIPNTNRSPVDLSLYLMPPKLRSNVSTPKTTRGPPIANISTISKLTTLKSCGMRRFQNSSMESLPVPSDKKNTVVCESLQPDFLPTSFAPESGGGKMKNKLTRQHQPSAGNASNEQFESTPLPNVPLPISTLPTFNFGTKSSRSAGDANKTGNEFVFSNPIVVLPKSPLSPVLQNNFTASNPGSKVDKHVSLEKPTFTFLSPIELELPSSVASRDLFSVNTPKSAVFTAPLDTKTSEEWECSSCLVKNPLKESNCIACETLRDSTQPASTIPSTKGGSGFGTFTNPPSTWECSSCWIRNSLKEVKCLACEAPKQGATSVKAASGFSSFVNPPSTWECSSCWIRNPLKEVKCLACEAPKQGAPSTKAASGFGSFTNPPSTWECSSCWIRNPLNEVKCLACEAPKQGPTSMSALSGFSGNSSKPSTWECSACWIRNPLEETKCLACETPNPSQGKSSGGSLDNTSKGPTNTLSATSNGFFSIPSDNPPSGFKMPDLSNAPQTVSFGGFKLPAVTSSSSEKSNATLQSPSTLLSENTLSSRFPISSWECDTCLIRNASDKRKCSACETYRPSTGNTTDPESFKFNSPSQSSPITFKFGSFTSTPQATTSSTFLFGAPSSTGTSTVFSSISSTVSNTVKSLENPKSVFLTEPSPKLSVPDFKFEAPKMPSVEVTKPDIPVVDLVDNNDSSDEVTIFGGTPGSKSTGESGTSTSGTTFKLTSSVIGSASFSPPTTTGNKLPLANAAKVEVAAANFQLTSDSKTVASKSEQSKEITPGGFNFKVPSTLGTSAFGGFSMPASNTESKNLFSVASSEKTTSQSPSLAKGADASGDKKSESLYVFGGTSPFALSTSTAPVFKVGDKVDTTKTTVESSLLKSVLAPSVSSSGVNLSAFNFTSAPISMSPSTTAQQKASLPPAQSQFQTSVTKSTDVKTVASVAPFCSAATSSAFTFGNSAAATTQSSTPSGGFSFFASTTTAAATTTTTPSQFTFGTSSNAAQPPKPGGFTFKAPNEEKPASSNSPAFGVPTTTATISSVFTFGATTPASTGGFVFGAAVKTEPASTASTNFAFGTGTATSVNPSTFSGFQTNPAPAFQFGSQPASNSVAAPAFGVGGSGFSFGSKNEAANQLTTATSQAPASGFGCTPMQQPMFGGAIAPAFGKTEKQTGFSFGASAAPSTAPAFQFGTAEKKQATTSQFFGQQEIPSPSQFQPQFNISTPTSFNFAATSTQAGPFQFAASSSDNINQSSGPRKIRKALRRVMRKD